MFAECELLMAKTEAEHHKKVLIGGVENRIKGTRLKGSKWFRLILH